RIGSTAVRRWNQDALGQKRLRCQPTGLPSAATGSMASPATISLSETSAERLDSTVTPGSGGACQLHQAGKGQKEAAVSTPQPRMAHIVSRAAVAGERRRARAEPMRA